MARYDTGLNITRPTATTKEQLAYLQDVRGYANMQHLFATAVDRLYREERMMYPNTGKTSRYAAEEAGKAAKEREAAMHRMKRIRERLEAYPELQQYEFLLTQYDWSEGEKHLDWVASAPIDEIIAWAEAIRAQEQE